MSKYHSSTTSSSDSEEEVNVTNYKNVSMECEQSYLSDSNIVSSSSVDEEQPSCRDFKLDIIDRPSSTKIKSSDLLFHEVPEKCLKKDSVEKEMQLDVTAGEIIDNNDTISDNIFKSGSSSSTLYYNNNEIPIAVISDSDDDSVKTKKRNSVKRKNGKVIKQPRRIKKLKDKKNSKFLEYMSSDNSSLDPFDTLFGNNSKRTQLNSADGQLQYSHVNALNVPKLEAQQDQNKLIKCLEITSKCFLQMAELCKPGWLTEKEIKKIGSIKE